MGSLSIWHWLVIVLILLVLFGGRRIAGLMGDAGKGVTAFRRELQRDSAAQSAATRVPHDTET